MKKILKRISAFIMACMICVVCLPTTQANAVLFSINFELKSNSAMLINMSNGDIIYQKNPEVQQMPGTLTQIMTAVVCLENCENLNEKVVTDGTLFYSLGDYAYPADLRYALIYDKDVLTIKDLLSAMLLTSSCEASIILANHFGGVTGEKGFVSEMNNKAKAIGMKNTKFTNATGLCDANQYTTTEDMAILAKYAYEKTPLFRDIATQTEYTPSIANEDHHKPEDNWSWTHSNLLTQKGSEYYYSGVAGIKTSTLQEGGRSLVLYASNGGNRYMLITMGAPIYDEDGVSHYYHLDDAKNMLDWAFSEIVYQDIVSTGDTISEAPVAYGENQDYVIIKPAETINMLWIRSENMNTIQREKKIYENLTAPIHVGDKVGEMTLKYGGKEIAKVDLIASQNVERSLLKYNLAMIPGFLDSKWLTLSWVCGLLFSILYLVLCLLAKRQYNKKMANRKTKNVVRPHKNQHKGS